MTVSDRTKASKQKWRQTNRVSISVLCDIRWTVDLGGGGGKERVELFLVFIRLLLLLFIVRFALWWSWTGGRRSCSGRCTCNSCRFGFFVDCTFLGRLWSGSGRCGLTGIRWTRDWHRIALHRTHNQHKHTIISPSREQGAGAGTVGGRGLTNSQAASGVYGGSLKKRTG